MWAGVYFSLQILACIVCAKCACAQGTDTGRATVLRHAPVIDGRGGAALQDATLILEGGLIRSIGAVPQTQWPASAEVVDRQGKTVIPRLISDHSRLGLVEGTQAGADFQNEASLLQALHQYQAYGITTIVSLGMNGDYFYPLQ